MSTSRAKDGITAKFIFSGLIRIIYFIFEYFTCTRKVK